LECVDGIDVLVTPLYGTGRDRLTPRSPRSENCSRLAAGRVRPTPAFRFENFQETPARSEKAFAAANAFPFRFLDSIGPVVLARVVDTILVCKAVV